MIETTHTHKPPTVGFSFSKEVSMGHILTIMTLIGALVSTWFSNDKRVTLIEHVIADHSKVIKTLSDNQNITIRTQDRLSFIVEEMQRQNTWGKSATPKP